MKKHHIFFAALLALLLAGASCSGNKQSNAQEETSAQLEEARNAGREAARKIIIREFTDSMEFHTAILDANAEKSKFTMQGRKQSEAAFDTAFINTIRTTRPDLAAKLQ